MPTAASYRALTANQIEGQSNITSSLNLLFDYGSIQPCFTETINDPE